MNCNYAIHATHLLAFTVNKYIELQMLNVISKLNCKGSCKTPTFSHTLETFFKYMTKFMTNIPVIKDKMVNSPKVIMDKSLRTIII
jgi:hypothetical protein